MDPVNRRSFLTGLGAAVGLIAMPAPAKMWFVGAHMGTPGYTTTTGLFVPASDVKAYDHDILMDRQIILTHAHHGHEFVSTTNPEQLREYWAERRVADAIAAELSTIPGWALGT